MSGNIQGPQTATQLISAGQAIIASTTTGYYPAEGSRVVGSQYNWTANLAFAEDLSQLVAKGVETSIQSVFMDNSTTATPVSIYVLGSGQVLVCPAFSQATYPILFTGAPGFIISTTAQAASLTRCHFLNIPLSANVWGVNSPSYSPGGGMLIGGEYIGSPPELANGASSVALMDAYGSLYADTEVNAPTYSAGAWNGTGANTTDILTIQGSATKTIRIHQITYVSNATLGSALQVVRRSTADTGGTPNIIGAVPHDTNSAAATAVLTFYTTPPATLGNAVGSVIESVLPAISDIAFNYGQTDQSLVLRGVNQWITLFAPSTAGGAAGVKVKWTEI